MFLTKKVIKITFFAVFFAERKKNDYFCSLKFR